MGEPALNNYDDDSKDDYAYKPDLGLIQGGGEDSSGPQGKLRSVSDEDLSDAEDEASESPEATTAEQQESGAVDAVSDNEESEDGLYSGGNGDKKAKFWTRRRKAISASTAVVLIGGGFGIMTILSGPAQAIQLSALLSGTYFARNNLTSDISTRRMFNTLTSNRQKNNLTPLASVLATRNQTKLAKVGIEMIYETPTGKKRAKLQSVRINPNTPEGKSMLGKAMSEGINIPSAGPDQRILIDLRGTPGAELSRRLTEHMVDISGKKGIAGTVSTRRLKKLFGVNFHPMNVSKRKIEDLSEYLKRRRIERATEAKKGITYDVTTGEAIGSTDADGNPNPVDSSVSEDAKNTRATLEDLKSTTDPIEKKSKLKTFRNSSLFKAGASGAAIVAVTCAVRDVGKNVEEYQMSNIIKPLIRMTVNSVATGSQTQAMQDIDMNESRSANEPLYDEENGTTVFAAKPLVAASGRTGGTDIDPAVKSQIVGAYGGEEDTLFRVIDDVPGIGGICGANNFIGDLPVIKQIGELSNAALSKLSSSVTGKSLDEWMGDLVAVLAGDAVDVLAEGAELGNLLAYGGLLAGNGSAIVSGGAPLGPTQSYEWRQYVREQKLAKNQDKSFYQRMFDFNSVDSLAANLITSTASYSASLKSFSKLAQKTPFNLASNSFSTLPNIMSQSTFAQNIHGYDYGIPEFGLDLTQLNSERYEDIYDNIDRLEDNEFAKLKDANSKWGKCFGNPLDDTGNIVDTEVDNYKDIQDEECTKNYNNQDFIDYQIYIQDNVTIRSLACYEGIDETSCRQIGASAGTTLATTSTDIDLSQLGQPSDNIACSAGSNDMGIHTGYSGGNPVKIRLCEIPGFPSSSSESKAGTAYYIKGATGNVLVNSRVSGAILQLVTAAKNSGTSLAAVSSFRTMEHQQELCNKNTNCKTGNKNGDVTVATPGTSNHQLGVAIDYDLSDGVGLSSASYGTSNGQPASTTNPKIASGAIWTWLNQNASKYGMKQLWNEPWHWSATGN